MPYTSIRHITAVALLVAASLPVSAALITYTDRAAFDTAISGFTSTVLDFDAASAGALIGDGSVLGGIAFDYSALAAYGVSLAVTDGNQFGGSGPFDTTSGANFLGTNDGDMLQGGDDFDLGFGDVNAIGMYFLSADVTGADLLDADIGLTAGGGTALLETSVVQDVLADGSNVFFLGIVDDSATFSTASVTSTCCGYFLFNVDDIVTARLPADPSGVPLPGTLALLGLGLVATGLYGHRRREV